MTLEKWLDKYGRKQNIVVCDSDGNALFTIVADPELEALEEDPSLDEWNYIHLSEGEPVYKEMWNQWASPSVVRYYQKNNQFKLLDMEVIKTSKDSSKDLLALYLEPELYLNVDSHADVPEYYRLSDLKKMWRTAKLNDELVEEEAESFDVWLENRMLYNNGSLERLPY